MVASLMITLRRISEPDAAANLFTIEQFNGEALLRLTQPEAVEQLTALGVEDANPKASR